MISFLGQCVSNLFTSIKYLCSQEMRWRNMISQAAAISYDSLPISVIICFIAAAVIAIQVAKQFLLSGADTYIGGSIAIVIIREIAPGFAALAIGARAGTSIAAEIANMKVTSQVDAMKTLNVNPVGYYFTPRIVAGALTVPFVVIIAGFIGVLGGLLVSYLTIGLHPNRYINSVWLWINTRDLYICVFKAFIFGGLVSLVCATQGYMTSGGAKEVGISTTKAAIKSTVYLLAADLLINLVFYV